MSKMEISIGPATWKRRVKFRRHNFCVLTRTAMAVDSRPKCKRLVLDAGPLLSLSPLRGLAETYITTPQVLAELKDKRAREHFERLGLNAGVKIDVQSPDPASIAHGMWLLDV